MFIDFKHNQIILSQLPIALKSYQIFQFNRWGFTKDNRTNTYSTEVDNTEETLNKLIDYCQKEVIGYTLSTTCKEILQTLNQRVADFENIKKNAKNFKEKEYDLKEYNNFVNFTKKVLVRRLKNHQLKAAYHLYLIKNGANFSVPGSGKTSVVLSVYEKLRLAGQVNTLFVIGPASCFSPWKKEFILTLGRNPKYKILAGGIPGDRKLVYFANGATKSELYLITFQSLLNDLNEVVTFLNQRGVETFLVIDEAHYIKQIEGNWARAVLSLSKYAKYKCVLTGTPLPRSYTDIFNLFDFLWSDNNPIDFEKKIKIKTLEDYKKNEDARKIIQETIGPLFFRVTKSELGLKPPIFHKPNLINMNKYEKIIYDAIQKKIRDYVEEDYLKNINFINILRRGRIMRLRQCVSYIKLLRTAIEDYQEKIIDEKSDLWEIIDNYDNLEKPAKLEYLVKFVTEMQEKKQKIIIWSNFIGTLELIQRELNQCGYKSKLIIGRTPIERESVSEEETREKIRDEFLDPNSGLDILIANPAACAESISLHKTCHNAIYYDLSYNCAQYLQSLDRIHRVGGSEKITAHYYFLQYKDTIDHDIMYNLNQKSKKMYDIIEEGINVYSLNLIDEGNDDIQAYERLFISKK